MSQFEKKKSNKVKSSVRFDQNDLDKAKVKNINISAVCRYALKLAIAGKLYKSKKEA